MHQQARCDDRRVTAGRAPHTGAGVRPGRTRDRVVRGLLAEWDDLDRPTAWAAVASWGRRHPAVLAGCRTLTDVLQRVDHAPDPVLLALLSELAAGDDLAGRVVVQAMLPKLRSLARRDPHHDVADYLSWFWLRARNYPVARRPRQVAANLALDTLKSAKRSLRTAEEPWIAEGEEGLDWLATEERRRAELDHLGDVAALTAPRVIRAARELGLVDTTTCRVLMSVYAEGLSGEQAAARHHVSVATLRWRCSQAVRKLAAHAEALLEAA